MSSSSEFSYVIVALTLGCGAVAILWLRALAALPKAVSSYPWGTYLKIAVPFSRKWESEIAQSDRAAIRTFRRRSAFAAIALIVVWAGLHTWETLQLEHVRELGQ